MAKTRKNRSKIQIEYFKQRKRVQNALSRLRASGYDVSNITLPAIPKKITTQSVNRLSKIKPSDLRERAKSYNPIQKPSEELKKEYKRNRQRLQKAIERARKKGIDVTGFTLPKIPKEITPKEVDALKRISSKDITQGKLDGDIWDSEYKKRSIAPTPQSGDYDLFSKIVISNYKAHIASFNETCFRILSNWVDAMIAQYGYDEVAQMLEKGAEAGYIVTYQIAYSVEKINNYIIHMLDYLEEMGTLERDTFIDALEMDDDWEDVNL